MGGVPYVATSPWVFDILVGDAKALARFVERSPNVDFRFRRIEVRMFSIGFSPCLRHVVSLTIRTICVVSAYNGPAVHDGKIHDKLKNFTFGILNQ